MNLQSSSWMGGSCYLAAGVGEEYERLLKRRCTLNVKVKLCR